MLYLLLVAIIISFVGISIYQFSGPYKGTYPKRIVEIFRLKSNSWLRKFFLYKETEEKPYLYLTVVPWLIYLILFFGILGIYITFWLNLNLFYEFLVSRTAGIMSLVSMLSMILYIFFLSILSQWPKKEDKELVKALKVFLKYKIIKRKKIAKYQAVPYVAGSVGYGLIFFLNHTVNVPLEHQGFLLNLVMYTCIFGLILYCSNAFKVVFSKKIQY
ncbi:MAG: hypothetical protein FWE36_08025 [Erysipelotrichales bacterium]|nr:hypothetical protein [Erysipelotrichales bacterium]